MTARFTSATNRPTRRAALAGTRPKCSVFIVGQTPAPTPPPRQSFKGTNLFFSTYNTITHTSSILSSIIFSNKLGGVFVDAGRNLAVGVDFVGVAGSQPDAVALYDITLTSSPALIGRYSFPVNQVAN